MSKEWHPDKHPSTGSGQTGQVRKEAEDKFKEINEAYETLNDPKKKQMFDQFGSTDGYNGAQGFPGFDASSFSSSGLGDFADLFENFFGGGGGRGRPADESGRDQQTEITVDLQEVLSGADKILALRGFQKCDTCKGEGTAEGASLARCDECGGTGQVTKTSQSFFGSIQQRTVCHNCGGSGKVPTEKCKTCGGEGRTSGRRDVTVRVPAGIEDGQSLRLRGEGEAGRRGGASGDLFVRIRVTPDPRFVRDGADIRSTISIPVTDAILGSEQSVETVQGAVTLKITEGTQPGDTLRIRGKGLPVLGTGRHGDHYVQMNVEIPKKLSRAERKLVEEWKEMI